MLTNAGDAGPRPAARGRAPQPLQAQRRGLRGGDVPPRPHRHVQDRTVNDIFTTFGEGHSLLRVLYKLSQCVVDSSNAGSLPARQSAASPALG